MNTEDEVVDEIVERILSFDLQFQNEILRAIIAGVRLDGETAASKLEKELEAHRESFKFFNDMKL